MALDHALPGSNVGAQPSIYVRVGLPFPCQRQVLRIPSKGKLTPFHNRYRKLRNFRVADDPLGTLGRPCSANSARPTGIERLARVEFDLYATRRWNDGGVEHAGFGMGHDALGSVFGSA